METDFLTWIFLGGGIILMLMELVLPAGVALFLGFSGLTVGILRFFGILSGAGVSVAAWLIISIGLTLAIRPFLNKYFKPESFYKIADEDYEAMDKIAVVTKRVNDRDNSGRIRFDGTSWSARSMDGSIKEGDEVKIRFRENTTWIVESVGITEPTNQQLKQPNKN